MRYPLFLLGAGFNKDAKNEAGKIEGINCDYPLVDELYKTCFPSADMNSSVSIEELISDDINSNNY